MVKEFISQLPPDKLSPFAKHPYRVREDAAMDALVESVRTYGILSPLLARPKGEGYELVSGHRRRLAAQKLGLSTVPVLVREMSDDEAVILMVDSNLQRENILPSERAKAYQMKLEAIRRRAGRPKKEEQENGGQFGHDFEAKKAREIIAEEAGDSPRNVQRFIRLNELSEPLRDKVDNGELGFTPAVELSFLKPQEQEWVERALDETQQTPSLSQAQRIKQESKEGTLTEDTVHKIISEEKKPLYNSVTLSHDTLKKYFPKSYTAKQMENVIIRLLDSWLKKRQQAQER